MRNRIGKIDYDDCGAIGYLATERWRRGLADVFAAPAYCFSPTTITRKLGIALRLVKAAPYDEECPF